MARVQMGDDNGLKNDARAWGTEKNGDYNNRFYMDLEGAMKVNPYMTARFTIEKNARYRDREVQYKGAVAVDEKGNAHAVNLPVTGELRDMPDMDTNHNGSISNIWVELQLGPKHDWYTNIGRKWNGIGMQNLLLGGQAHLPFNLFLDSGAHLALQDPVGLGVHVIVHPVQHLPLQAG